MAVDRQVVRDWIEEHEGRRPGVYYDGHGILTVGIGFNLEEPRALRMIKDLGVDYSALCAGECELNEEQIGALFDSDLDLMMSRIEKVLPGFDSHPDEVQLAIYDMLFNLGGTRFRGFVKLIAALNARQYGAAALEMKASKWFAQVPKRAQDDIDLVMKHAEKTA